MANLDNSSANLEVKDYFKENGYDKQNDSLGDLYTLQANTQDMYFTKHGTKAFKDFNIGDLVDYLLVNNHAIIDELHEMLDAVGGIKDGTGNAAWKPWKSANKKTRELKLSDLSKGDL